MVKDLMPVLSVEIAELSTLHLSCVRYAA